MEKMNGGNRMANLKTNFLGYELKNPVGVSSCDYGE